MQVNVPEFMGPKSPDKSNDGMVADLLAQADDDGGGDVNDGSTDAQRGGHCME